MVIEIVPAFKPTPRLIIKPSHLLQKISWRVPNKRIIPFIISSSYL